MFGNLVQIELIRLLKNKTLKVCAVVGVLIVIFFLMVTELLIISNALATPRLEGLTPAVFRGVMLTTSFMGVMLVVIPVTVVYTTCGYQKARLAVNIEGAVRSRLKLCLSEITGIALFIVMLNLLMFPGLVLLYLSHPSDIVFVANNNWSDILYMYVVSTVSNIYTSLVVYLISKFTSKAPLALALSFLVSAVGFVLTIAIALVAGSSSSSSIGPSELLDVIMYILLAVPVVVLSIALAVRYRKADRI